MPLRQEGMPRHTRVERYEVTFRYVGDELDEVWRLTKPMEIVPDTITLVWVRRFSEPWRRVSQGLVGSRAEGFMKAGADEPGTRQRRCREIFDRDLGRIRTWAVYLPALGNLVKEIESNLPD